MSEIKVPEGMLDAAINADTGIDPDGSNHQAVLEAALRWLSENPMEPTWEQVASMEHESHVHRGVLGVAVEWQRRMFLAPKQEESFEERMNRLTFEVNRIGMTKAIEILREAK